MFKDGGQEGEVEGNELDTVAVVELVLELNPKIKHSGRRAHLVTTKTEHRLTLQTLVDVVFFFNLIVK